MRRLLFLSLMLAACGTSPSAGEPTPGVRGIALAGSLAVHVVRESDLTPIAGASVDVGGASVTTDANGDATLSVSTSPVTLHVTSSGYIGERWMGLDRDHATVGLALPIPSHHLSGTITAGTEDARVIAATAFSMLRTSTPTASIDACPGGACSVSLVVDTSDTSIDVLVVDSTSARLAPHVAIVGDHFAIDESTTMLLSGLVTLDVTIPEAPGLEGVVGVPGIAGDGRVSLIAGATGSATNVIAPTLEGPLASDRLWYVARATSTSGDSMIFDRHVDGTSVHLPSSFLAVPIANASSVVTLTIDPEVDFYVLDTESDAGPERLLVLHPSGTQLTLPLPTGYTHLALRAVATSGTEEDLIAAEALADRIANRSF